MLCVRFTGPSYRASEVLVRRGARCLALLAWFSMAICASVHAQEPPKKDDAKGDKPAAGQQMPGMPGMPGMGGPAAPGTVTFSGLVDGYYQIDFQHPRAVPMFAAPTTGGNSGGIVATRAFDYRNNFALSLGEIGVTRTAGKGFPLGITATLGVGDTTPVLYANEPGKRNGFEGIIQLYLTYTPHLLRRDVAIDFGKFLSPVGYEVLESTSNDNYSRGLLYTFAMPFYHTGLRVSTPIANKVTFVGGLVNGWNNSTDDNEAKSFFAQVMWTPDSHFMGMLTYLGGSEGTGAYGSFVPRNGAGNITTNLFDFVATYIINPRLKLAGEIIYGAAAGDVQGAHVSGDWLGMAAYARYQWTSRIATTVRLEQFEDLPGAGRLPGASAGGLRLAAGYAKLNSLTVTLEYAAFRKHLISRLEYRHDKANQPFGAIGPDQDTLTLGEAYKF